MVLHITQPQEEIVRNLVRRQCANYWRGKCLLLSPLLREEVRKLDKYIEDYKLLCDCHIDTAEELFAFRENVDAQIEELKQER